MSSTTDTTLAPLSYQGTEALVKAASLIGRIALGELVVDEIEREPAYAAIGTYDAEGEQRCLDGWACSIAFDGDRRAIELDARGPLALALREIVDVVEGTRSPRA